MNQTIVISEVPIDVERELKLTQEDIKFLGFDPEQFLDERSPMFMFL
jgi:hypothetical protein